MTTVCQKFGPNHSSNLAAPMRWIEAKEVIVGSWQPSLCEQLPEARRAPRLPVSRHRLA